MFSNILQEVISLVCILGVGDGDAQDKPGCSTEIMPFGDTANLDNPT